MVKRIHEQAHIASGGGGSDALKTPKHPGKTKRCRVVSASASVTDAGTGAYYYRNKPRRINDAQGRTEQANFFMSPLYEASFVHAGVQYRSVTHFMQAAKYVHDPLYQRVILETTTPMDALYLGKHILPRRHKYDTNATDTIRRIIQNRQGDPDALYRRPEWNSVRADLFQTATLCKFAQNPALGHALIQTHPNPIVEDSTDPDWGGSSGGGGNLAGQTLVRVRTLIRQENTMVSGSSGVNRQLFPCT